MTSLQANQDRQAPAHHQGQCLCDRREPCEGAASSCAQRVPVLLMPQSAIDRLRAVEMNTLALSDDEVHDLESPRQLGLSF
ncbi:MAG: hypothetical protein QM749_08920 [Aquabacterium sp.]